MDRSGWRRAVLGLGVLLALAAAASAETAREQRFAEGVAAYDQGDYTGAMALWEPLADDGDLAAMRNMGQLYRRGLGVAQDLRKARRWYAKAAQAGLPSAQVNLGVMLLEGQGTKAQPKDAAQWFYKAARAGDANGQYFLGLQLENGWGMERNVEKARAYYAAAAAHGHTLAARALARLGGPPPVPEGVHLSSEKPSENDEAAPKLPRKDPRRLYGGTGLLREPGSLEEVER